jgi:hypothetical protein
MPIGHISNPMWRRGGLNDRLIVQLLSQFAVEQHVENYPATLGESERKLTSSTAAQRWAHSSSSSAPIND